MNLQYQITIEQIDDLIKNLEKEMDPRTNSHKGSIMKVESSYNSELNGIDSANLKYFNKIWEGFLEYCSQNELDPDQQLREAAASYYQDLLTSYKIAYKLAWLNGRPC